MTYNLPFFENLNIKTLKDYYKIDIQYEGQVIRLDLNFNELSVDESRLSIVKNYLDSISDIIQLSKKAIQDDFESGEDVKDYLAFHSEEFDDDTLESLGISKDKDVSVEQQMLSIIKLRRIGFYPEDEDHFAVLDYTIGTHVTQYLLAVTINDRKELEYITMES